VSPSMAFSSFASVHSPCALLGADDMPVAMVKRVKIVELVAVLPEAQCLPAPRIPASQTRGGCRTVMHRPVDSLAAMKVTGRLGQRWALAPDSSTQELWHTSDT